MASTRPTGQLRVVRRHDGIELRHDPASPGKACVDRLIKHRPRQNDGVHVQEFLFLCSTAIPYQCAASPKTPMPIRSLWQIGKAPLRWQAEKKCLGKLSGLSGHPCMGSRARMTSFPRQLLITLRYVNQPGGDDAGLQTPSIKTAMSRTIKVNAFSISMDRAKRSRPSR